jgi:hypothetical protein
VTEEAQLSLSLLVDTFVDRAFGSKLSRIQPPVSISKRVRVFAFLSAALPLALVPEVLLPYPNYQWAAVVFLATFTIIMSFRVVMLRLRLVLIHRHVSLRRRWSAISFLSTLSFADVLILWTTFTDSYLGLAVAAVVAATVITVGFAITQVRLPVPKEQLTSSP